MKMQNLSVSASDINKRIAAYSVGAGAAMLATSAASADIIWSGPLVDDFGDSGALQWIIEGSQSETRLTGTAAGSFSSLGGFPNLTYQNMEFVGANFELIDLLQTGDLVNSVAPFLANAYFYKRFSYFTVTPYGTISFEDTDGEWDGDGQKGFFGFRFDLENESGSGAPAGTIVYGWAEMERISASEGRLLQWAYDDSGAGIQVGAIPEPGTLGMLALGAAGLVALRRRKSV